MTDKLKEKAQQALGALEAAGYGGSYAAIELREALSEQAEQEPLLWGDDKFAPHERLVKQEHREPTHDEYLELAKNADIVADHEHCHLNEQEMNKAWVVEYGSQVYAKAWLDGVESAQQAKQDPVAWALTSENGEVLDCISHTYKVTQPCTVDYDEPLYAAPVRTKDLTDEEQLELARSSVGKSRHWLVAAVIAADRRKNRG